VASLLQNFDLLRVFYNSVFRVLSRMQSVGGIMTDNDESDTYKRQIHEFLQQNSELFAPVSYNSE